MDEATPLGIDPRELTVADRLVLARRALSWTQVVLCGLTGISPNTWNNYERRGQRPNLDEALKLMRVGIDPGWIYLGLMGNLRADLAAEIQRLLMFPAMIVAKPPKRRRSRRR